MKYTITIITDMPDESARTYVIENTRQLAEALDYDGIHTSTIVGTAYAANVPEAEPFSAYMLQPHEPSDEDYQRIIADSGVKEWGDYETDLCAHCNQGILYTMAGWVHINTDARKCTVDGSFIADPVCVTDVAPDGLWGCNCTECKRLQREAEAS